MLIVTALAIGGVGAGHRPLQVHAEGVAAAESDTAAPMIPFIGEEVDPRAENTMARGGAQAQGKFKLLRENGNLKYY